MEESRRTYIPAAGHDWALPLYDPIVKLFGGDWARRALLDQATIQTGHSLNDNTDSRIIALMSQAGLANPKVVGRRALLFGKIAYYQASAVP